MDALSIGSDRGVTQVESPGSEIRASCLCQTKRPPRLWLLNGRREDVEADAVRLRLGKALTHHRHETDGADEALRRRTRHDAVFPQQGGDGVETVGPWCRNQTSRRLSHPAGAVLKQVVNGVHRAITGDPGSVLMALTRKPASAAEIVPRLSSMP